MFQKYTTGRKNHLYNLEVVKVTTQEAEQCKTRFSSYKLKTGVQTRLKLLSVQLYESLEVVCKSFPQVMAQK